MYKITFYHGLDPAPASVNIVHYGFQIDRRVLTGLDLGCRVEVEPVSPIPGDWNIAHHSPVPPEEAALVSNTDPEYDPYTDPDMETCSWCTNIVPDSTLVEMDDGSRICRECLRTLDPATNPRRRRR